MGKDSSELLWDDINRPKFYTLLTCASAAIRTCLYPAALVKTRLQASSSQGTGGSTGSGGGVTPARQQPHAAGMHLRGGARAATLDGRYGMLSMPTYNGTGHAFRTILRTEGKFALYRGFRMNLVGLACDPIVIGCIEFSRTQLTYYSERFTPYKNGHYESPFFRYVMSPTTAITLLTAGGSACIGQIIQVPVDVISQKKQMQLHPLQGPTGEAIKTPGTSSIAVARQIINAEGIRGLYKGFGITLCSATPFASILWAVYWPTQRFLHKGLTAPVSSASPPFSASLPPASIGLPTEKQAHPPVYLRHRDLPKGAILPPEEEQYLMAEKQHERERQRAHQRGQSIKFEPETSGWVNWRESLPTPVAAFVASCAASLATQPIGQNVADSKRLILGPHATCADSRWWLQLACYLFADVIKTRLQVAGGSKTTLMSTIRALIKERGYRGLAAGWYPRLLAVTPQQTIMMSSYEVLKRYCQK